MHGTLPRHVLRPTPAEIDLGLVAVRLSHVNLFAGDSAKPLSAAQITIMLLDAAPHALRRHAALHVAACAYLGDVTDGAVETFSAIAAEANGKETALALRTAVADARYRWNAAIHGAAGIALPVEAERMGLFRAELIALRTATRDFGLASFGRWTPEEVARATILQRKYSLRGPADLACDLLGRFRQLFPDHFAR